MTATAVRAHAGTLADGRVVERATLSNAHGTQITLLTLGATMSEVRIRDRDGVLADVVLGHETLDGYVIRRSFFGATVGRFANRIANSRFALDGAAHQLAANDGPNALHGGPAGFDQANWTLSEIVSGDEAMAVFRLVSPAGDQGYPGTLTVSATYILDDTNTFTIAYRATTDAATVVNLTNHAYWNLAGGGSAMDHILAISADSFLPCGPDLIPTGELRAVVGTPFDFRRPRAIGEHLRDGTDAQLAAGRGYDHNFVIARDESEAPRVVARLVDLRSGRGFELSSNQPGLQFYSGNFLDGTTRGKRGTLYRQGDAVALEPQRFPDTPNRPEFGSARLDPGEEYRHIIEYRFFVDDAAQRDHIWSSAAGGRGKD